MKNSYTKETAYKKRIASFLNTAPDNIYLYWKGRVALYALLKAMGVQKGDEIILPAFTCVVVANAIKYLEAVPVYVDIEEDTYNPSLLSIKEKITPRTKVIICQNTFGLSTDTDTIVELAKSYHIYTIEDCTHGFGGYYLGQPNGTYCDAAFFSTQWNKPYSTGIGGFAFIQNKQLKSEIDIINRELLPATFVNNLSLRLLYFAKENVMNKRFYWPLLSLYRFFSKFNLVQGSSSGGELVGTEMPKNYFKQISETQINKGLQTIEYLPKTSEIRKKNAILYSEYLQKKGIKHVAMSLFDNHSFLLYPILVNNRDVIMEMAKQERIGIGDWFCSPLHPVKEDLTLWDLDISKYPIAKSVSERIINLPTAIPNIEPVLDFLEKIDGFVSEQVDK